MKRSTPATGQYERMTETPVSRLIITLGIPTTISMLITNIYNMADSYFVSRVSLSAGGATSIVFGIMSVLQAFGFMFGHGAGINVSRLLGEKNVKRARSYSSLSFFCAVVCGVAILVFGLAFLEPFLRLLGSTDTILPYAKDYAFWILIAAPAMTASCVLNNVLRYEGKATFAMVGLTAGGILNMALDPLFIFTCRMGISGAGLATALSQYISFFILLSVFLMKKTESRISLRYLTFSPMILGDIIATGLPSLARQGLNSASTMVLNAQAKIFGDAAIAAMGYVSRTTALIFCVGLGIGQGYQPVAGFNFGARKYSRVKKGSYFTLTFGAIFIGVIAAACFALAPQIISIFRKEAQVVQIGATALRIHCAFIVTLPVSVVATMLFQSVGKKAYALILSCLQSGLLFIPLCVILARAFGITGIQISQPVAYLLSATVAFPFMVLFLRKLPEDGRDPSNERSLK